MFVASSGDLYIAAPRIEKPIHAEVPEFMDFKLGEHRFSGKQ